MYTLRYGNNLSKTYVHITSSNEGTALLTTTFDVAIVSVPIRYTVGFNQSTSRW